MRLETLGARHFRNLEEFQIEPHPRFNVIAGPNAQGKTNLLESIFVLGTLKSFRVSNTSDLVEFDQNIATLAADLQKGPHHRNLRVEVGGRARKVWVNNKPIRRLSDYLGTLQVVLFAPEDVALLKGPPTERRTFVDRAVFNAKASYLEDLNRYNEVLKQRNRVLKDEHPRLDLLDVYDVQLIELGARVLHARLEFLEAFAIFFKAAFADIFGAHVVSELRYLPSWTDEVDFAHRPGASEISEKLQAALTARRRDELRRGHSLVGPHRDDFTILLDGKAVKTHASQGQHRSMVLALKTSEITMLRERFEIEPILLLDDVSSELDASRNAQLFDFLRGFTGQVFISTTSREFIQIQDDVSTWNVANGRFTPA